MRRLLFGALAGIGATVAMTAAMRHLHRNETPGLQYPLPPRELVQQTATSIGMPKTDHIGRNLHDNDEVEALLADATVTAHFGYGALAGALFAVLTRRRSATAGIFYGAAVWAGSYLGWIPAAGLLTPATEHPPGRNRLMLIAHGVWGAALAIGLGELEKARDEDFGAGPIRDATRPRVPDERAPRGPAASG